MTIDELATELWRLTDDIHAVEAYLKEKGVKTQPIQNTHDVVLILWVEDSEGNHLAFEQWIDRGQGSG